MAGITLEQAQAQLDALLAAQASRVLEVRTGDRAVRYASLKEIAEQVTYWQRIVRQLTAESVGNPSTSYRLADFSGRCR